MGVLVCRGRYGLGGVVLLFILGSNVGGGGLVRGLRGGGRRGCAIALNRGGGGGGFIRDMSVSQTSWHKKMILGRNNVFRVFLL